MQSLALMQILEIGLCIPLCALLAGLCSARWWSIIDTEPRTGHTDIVASTSHVGPGSWHHPRRNAIISPGHWVSGLARAVDTCNETRAPCKSFGNCDMSASCELWRLHVHVRAITSRPPSCTCNNLTTFYGLNSRNYIIYAHFSFSNIFPLLLKPTNLTFSNKLAVSRQIKIKCGLRMCGF